MMEDGFLIQQGVFSPTEFDRLIKVLARTSVAKGRAGTRNLMCCESVRHLANDPRLAEITVRAAGKRLIPYKATLFEKTGKANWLVAWHQDTALPLEQFEKREGWGVTSRKAGLFFAQAPASALSRIVAIRIHLDASTQTNGPLRVIPQSDRLGVLSAERIDEVVQKTKSETCLVGRGGIVAMSPLLLHASSKSLSNEPRRVLHIEYAETRDLEPGIRLAIS